ncbi:hypothetical protein PGTUg99_023838 [Puccinia graminis f. sp. tritici]|uniref:Uncharacterized protein n=1 Tax=Puccinia graminis f. sp. tritici TaxID=56615 RepID=A0A5B0Q1M7_PUCGR|nr:hypothetical protein PGTUg99_023838 [Puccinia graminis f. sp. tritici]
MSLVQLQPNGVSASEIVLLATNKRKFPISKDHMTKCVWPSANVGPLKVKRPEPSLAKLKLQLGVSESRSWISSLRVHPNPAAIHRWLGFLRLFGQFFLPV